MERGSDKHSARMDDALAGEVDGLIRAGHDNRADWNSPEPSGEDQPDVDLVPDGTLSGGVPAGMTEQDVEQRSEIASYLGRVWPATTDQLVEVAEGNSAPDHVLERLRGLPAGRIFASMQEVWSSLSGGHVEAHRY
ncbi:MAG: hypothetical protein JWN88_688 [Frankiales bacterium]|jgi:hypothetical protein|nr:hypothetical protein [Frankiales bacterium]